MRVIPPDFGPIPWHRRGQLVICVKIPTGFVPGLLGPAIHLRLKEVYTIEAVETHPLFTNELFFCLLNHGHNRYAANLFRPVDPTNIEQFEKLLAPSDRQKNVEYLRERYEEGIS